MGEKTPNWHENVFFGIHYDLHANAQDTELGRELTPEHLQERLERIRPDWIQCDCKGHPGYTSWPTAVGSTSPGVVRDALRIHREVTRRLGIPLGVHYSGVIDCRAIELHPEWACVNANGERNPRSTCRLSAYADELMIPQLLEIIEKYDVDGFWVDGENWGSPPCWCDRCRKEFTRRTGITDIPTEKGQPHWDEWLAFHRDVFCEYVAKYAEAVHKKKPGCLVCSNWMYTIRQPDPVTVPVDYLSGDYTPNWGAARAALEGRMLDNRGITWDLMAWGFTRNYQVDGSPWSMKPVVHLKQEVAEVVALGGAVMVYVKPHRTGWLTGWEHDIVAEVAAFCRARKDSCFRSESRSEAAVLHVASHYYANNDPLFNYGAAVQPLEAALNAMLELGLSTDILTEDKLEERLSRYRLVVAPEQTGIPRGTLERLGAWVEQGGCLLLSGTHLASELSALTGCRVRGEPRSDALYVPVGCEAVLLPGPWQSVAVDPDVEVRVRAVENLEPDRVRPETAVVTCRNVGQGKILAVHAPLFRAYFALHDPRLRRFIDTLVRGLNIEWTVRLEGPPWAELIAREKDGAFMLNIVNRGAGETLSPNRTILDELPPLTDLTLYVRRDSPPREVRLLPSRVDLPWTYADGELRIRVPLVHIHEVVCLR